MLRALEERLEPARRADRGRRPGLRRAPARDARGRARLHRSPATTSATGRVEALRAGHSYVEDVSSEQLRSAIESGYDATTDPGGPGGLRRRDHHRSDPAAGRRPRPLVHRDRGERSRPAPAARACCVVLESTTYPGTTEELLRPALEQSGLAAGTDFFLGYSPERVDPGNPQVVAHQHAQSRVGHRRRLARRGHRVLRPARRHGRPGRIDRRGGAREAAREHLPPRQHRAR